MTPPILQDIAAQPVAFYVVLVAVCGLWTYWRVQGWLGRARHRLLDKLRRRRQVMSVSTDAPGDNPNKEAKERGLANIKQSFTISRRLIAPIIFVTTLFFAALPFLNRIPAAMMTAVATVATVLVGLALKPLLENTASGLVISLSRVVNIGDTVSIDGFYGTVEDVSTTHTSIKLWDWRRLVLPNSQLLQKNFVNYSLLDSLVWVCAEFWVAHDADLRRVEQIATQAAAQSDYFNHSEPPRFWVISLDPSSVRCWVAAWADNPARAWELKHEIQTAIVLAFARENIATHAHRALTAPADAIHAYQQSPAGQPNTTAYPQTTHAQGYGPNDGHNPSHPPQAHASSIPTSGAAGAFAAGGMFSAPERAQEQAAVSEFGKPQIPMMPAAPTTKEPS